MMKLKSWILGVATLALLAPATYAEQPAAEAGVLDPWPEPCKLVGRSDTVLLMLCEPGLGQEVWSLSGGLACGLQHRCNVWMWDDAANVPEQAPAMDKDIPKASIATAIAVWANDSKSLLVLKPVSKQP